ncbi:MAG: undecaprenyl-phosphate glucose phosphotransferase [Gammaproteobacteria bacterium]|nr:undecaprenyl-phosphate glucose phosphotransferase [Gammaproteobacteria bacterium]MDH5801214.1 undecaprenyl-phosphate glucose phosphotransferase [Gammaproteobacteria bacterium]
MLDVICVLLSACVAHYWRFGNLDFSISYQAALLIAAMLTFIVFSASGIYTSWRGKNWVYQVRVVMLAWIVVLTLLVVISVFTKTSIIFSRQWMIMWAFSGGVCLVVFRIGFYELLKAMRKRGWNHKRIVIVGIGELGLNVAEKIRNAAWTGLDIVAFVGPENSEYGLSAIDSIPVVPSSANLFKLIEEKKVNEVWLALPLREEERMVEILSALRHSTVNIRFVPGIFGFRLLNHSITEVAGLPVIDLSASPMVGMNRFIKELEDRLLALLILLLVSPLLAIVALGVKLTSSGPVFFKQMRHGWDGRPVKIYKFRTMTVHEEADGEVTQATKGDTRITPFGAFLRRTSLDELPQFMNVLQGRMSIVGPRPHALAHNEFYKDQIDAYMLRHKVKPGITGWAQVNGLRGETDTLDKMKRRVEYDLYYVENWSLWLDLKIILMTLYTGFIHKNAY